MSLVPPATTHLAASANGQGAQGQPGGLASLPDALLRRLRGPHQRRHACATALFTATERRRRR
jgi:hypothetical protein